MHLFSPKVQIDTREALPVNEASLSTNPSQACLGNKRLVNELYFKLPIFNSLPIGSVSPCIDKCTVKRSIQKYFLPSS